MVIRFVITNRRSISPLPQIIQKQTDSSEHAQTRKQPAASPQIRPILSEHPPQLVRLAEQRSFALDPSGPPFEPFKEGPFSEAPQQ